MSNARRVPAVWVSCRAFFVSSQHRCLIVLAAAARFRLRRRGEKWQYKKGMMSP